MTNAQSRSANESLPKWGKASWRSQSSSKVAYSLLESRLLAVWNLLPLAVHKCDEDVEYVHQLRIAPRRAAETVRLFSDLIDKRRHNKLRVCLRKVRSAADNARNMDVLAQLFSRSRNATTNAAVRRISAKIKRLRQQAQAPVLAASKELIDAQFDQLIRRTLKDVRRHGKNEGDRTFGQQAHRHLAAVLKRFFKAAATDLSDDVALHDLRLHTKKLRYTMEMVAVAFEPRFRTKLYPQIEKLQELMGAINDHATQKVFFHDWRKESKNSQEIAFLEGLCFTEARAHRNLKQAFLALWPPQYADKLRRQFRAVK